jgi:ribosomal protein S18 acetylase RimI-like enzyme
LITYQKINKKYITQITKIWEYGLKDNLYSVLGAKFISNYLNLILKIKGNKTFIAIDKRKNKVVGFVIFGKENKTNLKILSSNFLNIIIIILKKILFFQFKDLFRFVDVFLYLMISSFSKINFGKSTELLIIVIEKSYRSKKIGKKLLDKSISVIKKDNKKLKFIHVVTLSKLEKSINFYQKNKFKIKKKIYNRFYLLRNI